ncbi:MAG: RnfABCDGE type electron transport complex subunit D [Lawsonibacter sp.]|nr:RnfABCDGE type electron transport complex subunit D [Lawsonibacter sp.]
MANKLIVSAAPHITSADSTSKIMQRVCIALLPALAASVVIYGFSALLLTAVTVAACVLFEYGYCKLMGRDTTINDFSAVVTGMLLAFNLPAGMPVWMAVVGALISIVVVKQLFGGLGYNFANPAIVGRIALALGFTGRMTTYIYPSNGIDALSSATPLAVAGELNAGSYVTLLLGNHGGVLGETCALAILAGGVYLIATKVISPMIPVSYLASVAVLSLCFGMDPIVQLLSGGLMLGAFFMATDYVTSPTTEKGKLIFGVCLGVITMMIRRFGTMNEGVSFAILLMNLVVPYIEINTRQDKLGIAKAKKEAAAK